MILFELYFIQLINKQKTTVGGACRSISNYFPIQYSRL